MYPIFHTFSLKKKSRNSEFENLCLELDNPNRIKLTHVTYIFFTFDIHTKTSIAPTQHTDHFESRANIRPIDKRPKRLTFRYELIRPSRYIVLVRGHYSYQPYGETVKCNNAFANGHRDGSLCEKYFHRIIYLWRFSGVTWTNIRHVSELTMFARRQEITKDRLCHSWISMNCIPRLRPIPWNKLNDIKGNVRVEDQIGGGILKEWMQKKTRGHPFVSDDDVIIVDVQRRATPPKEASRPNEVLRNVARSSCDNWRPPSLICYPFRSNILKNV